MVHLCPYCNSPQPPRPEGETGARLDSCDSCLNAFLIEQTDEGRTARALDGITPLSELAPAGSVMAGVMGRLNEAISELPVLPEIPQRILSMIHDPLTAMTDVANIISDDAAISMKVLKLANSAFFSSPHEIKELRTACARLGMKTIANVMHTTLNSGLYVARGSMFRALMQQMWQHAVASAHCADEVSALNGDGSTLPAFSAGLTHDIGKVVLLDTLTTKYTGGLGRLKESPRLLVSVLERFAPIAGLRVVQHWDLESDIAFATFFCGKPESVPAGSARKLTHLITLASDIADRAGYVIGEGEGSDLEEHPSLLALGLSAPAVEELEQDLPQHLEELLSIFSGL